MSKEQAASGATEVKEYTLEVMSPVSKASVKFQNAPRLPDLNGKVVGEWISRRQQLSGALKPGEAPRAIGHWREDEIFPIIEEELKKRFPKVKIVPGTELPCFEDFGSLFERKLTQQQKLDVITKAMKDAGCDAVILGNGA